MTIRLPFALLMLAAAAPASAHTGHPVEGFAAGLLHPLTGADHFLAMVAVGLWAVQRGARPLWLLPLAFLVALAAGALLALTGAPALGVEPGIGASVLALGLIIALARPLPVPVAVGLCVLFGLLHGHAHGLEMPGATSPAAYFSGFVLATAVLHLLGVSSGAALARKSGLPLRVTGGLIALLGVAVWGA